MTEGTDLLAAALGGGLTYSRAAEVAPRVARDGRSPHG
jgi:hypothetical protein